MKNLFLLSVLLVFSTSTFAQLFTKITEGPLVSTPADSRSVNFIDLNQDGWEDVFISNGLQGGQDNFLYLNNGDGTFSVDDSADLTNDNSPSVGATFADFDNDGDIDAYVTNWYGLVNELYQNDGAGQLNLHDIAPINAVVSHAETAAWGDYDNDGWLDLYVTNSGGTEQNILFRGLGEGDFERIDTGAWVTETDLSRNVNWTDFDGDGDLDLFVANEDNTRNDLFENDGAGNFSKYTTGGIVNTIRGSMSSSWGDVDNDGDLDHFVANAGYFQEKANQLFLNNNGIFTEVENQSFSTDGGCSYGSNFGDYDNDGDLDLIVMNGFCNNNLRNYLYENQNGVFVRKESEELPDLALVASYGGAWGDVNNDGFLDLVIANCKNQSGLPQPMNDFYLNQTNDNHWLKIKLTGTISNTSAIGAKVRLKATINGQEVWQMREVSSQSGYSGQNSLIVHFGLGEATQIDSISVEWPSGLKSELENVAINQELSMVEDMSNFIVEQNQKEGLNWSCFPNPSSGKVQVQVESPTRFSAQKVRFSLVDTLGKVWWREVQDNSSSANIWNLDFSHQGVVSGQYFLKMEWEEGVLVQKIIFQ